MTGAAAAAAEDAHQHHLAAFERQFLGLFASALPKPPAADPYHAIFAPSQQERAALPSLPMTAPAPASAPAHAVVGAGGAHAAFHHQHHHPAYAAADFQQAGGAGAGGIGGRF